MTQKSPKNTRTQLRAAAPADRRRTRLIIAFASIAVVVVALVIAVVVNSGSTTTSAPATVPQTDVQSIVAEVSSIPAAVQDGVGIGAAKSLPKPVSGKAISVDGKPEVLYVGAEYCPFCAAERWPLMIALSRFGTFTGVGITHSSSTDVYPNTPTLAFHGSSYTSDYVAFTAVELASNQPDGSGGYKPLDVLSADQQATVAELSPSGGIPFVDFGGRYVISGATFDPGVLSGRDAATVAGSLASASSEIAQGVLGAANTITATICQLTNNQPTTVCDTPAIKAIASQLTG
ncbi:MAG: DUF929 family protein [Ilumatobacteraceae bacterium]